jgi:two-component system sensor histidine kinase CreC
MRLSIGTKLFGAYFIINALVVWFVIDKAAIRIVKSVDEAAEEVMIDSSNLLAQMVGDNIQDNKIDTKKIKKLMRVYLNREVNANIYNTQKNNPNLQVYITDINGIVIYDSTHKFTGRDYSKWRDVSLTLKGKYGARVSSFDPNLTTDPTPEQEGMFVAAPIYYNNKIFGVLTTVKAMVTLKPYVVEQKQKITEYGLYLFLLSLILGGGVSYIISKYIKQLVYYTTQLSQGKEAVMPKIRQIEFSQLSKAIATLRTELEGREYVEEYINTMAHELRTPIAGIQATAENLLSPMSQTQRVHFINNILNANKKMDLLVTRLLELSRIERKNKLNQVEVVMTATLIKEVTETPSRNARLQNKKITLIYNETKNHPLKCEKLLAEQALGNIIDNAIDFTPQNSTIVIEVQKTNLNLQIKVLDQGEGISIHAKKQLFQRFFSSVRLDTGKRGNGLGLMFVKKIMDLHHGKTFLDNRKYGIGAVAILEFPL